MRRSCRPPGRRLQVLARRRSRPRGLARCCRRERAPRPVSVVVIPPALLASTSTRYCRPYTVSFPAACRLRSQPSLNILAAQHKKLRRS